MRKARLAIGVIAISALVAGCASIPRPGPVGNKAVPEPAKAVDLHRYLGRWYEQFRYEASFQKNMDAVIADYSMNDDGSLGVLNSGRKGGLQGQPKASRGRAKVVDKATNAKLKVSFFGPFYGDYWVLDRGDNYEWSIVGEPSGRYLWALTREAYPSGDIKEMLKRRVQELGYDTSLIRPTQQ